MPLNKETELNQIIDLYMEYPFITITPRSTLMEYCYYDSFNGSNRPT